MRGRLPRRHLGGAHRGPRIGGRPASRLGQLGQERPRGESLRAGRHRVAVRHAAGGAWRGGGGGGEEGRTHLPSRRARRRKVESSAYDSSACTACTPPAPTSHSEKQREDARERVGWSRSNKNRLCLISPGPTHYTHYVGCILHPPVT